MGRPDPARTVVVVCPDWPITAAGISPDTPAAVLQANRVVAVSVAARADGVRHGHRRREAQARCPELLLLAHDPDRDARAFEPVVTAVEELAPGVAVVGPGILAVRAQGPARYFGGEDQVVELLGAAVETQLTGTTPGTRVGVADGLFTALVASTDYRVVPPGGSATFLAPYDIATLRVAGTAGAGPERDDFVAVLRRLGLRTLGAFAALSAADVASRFDTGAVVAHRLARGLDPYPIVGRAIPIDLAVGAEFDPPADQVEPAAFAARAVAGQLQDRLAAHGLACTRLLIEIVTTAAEHHARHWRGDGALTATAIADRIRWQLDGWLSGRASARPTGGIARLRLIAEEVVQYSGFQLSLWGAERAEDDARVHRALARVQGMVGAEAVVIAVPGGGRGPAERIRLVAWQDEPAPAYPAAPPWPGRLPGPHPTTLPAVAEPVEVQDAAGKPVTVSSRQQLSAAPAIVRRGGIDRAVLAWAGPWTLDERWWDPAAARRVARLQVVLGRSAAATDPVPTESVSVDSVSVDSVSADAVPTESVSADACHGAAGYGAAGHGVEGAALLLARESGRWVIEGSYD
ncbi:MAG: DNA polymerase Y family protein [Actinomycetota bacterium]|nr:MAG: DNA polymerase Y family protein [Actinomycetota bacterium]